MMRNRILRNAVDTIKVSPAPVIHTPPPPPPPTQTIKVKKSIGPYRGGFTGFLLGCVVTGTLGYSTMMDEYHASTTTLLTSLDELRNSTKIITTLSKRIDGLEGRKVGNEGVDELRREVHDLMNKLRIEQLSLKAKIEDL